MSKHLFLPSPWLSLLYCLVSELIKRSVETTKKKSREPEPPSISIPHNTHETLSMIEAYLMQLKEESPGKQVAVGGAAGFVVGYISGKLGRSIIRTIGLTLLLIHIGERQGYIYVDWSKLNNDSASLRQRMKDQVNTASGSWFSRLKSCLQGQYLTATGLSAGLLLGLGSSWSLLISLLPSPSCHMQSNLFLIKEHPTVTIAYLHADDLYIVISFMITPQRGGPVSNDSIRAPLIDPLSELMRIHVFSCFDFAQSPINRCVVATIHPSRSSQRTSDRWHAWLIFDECGQRFSLWLITQWLPATTLIGKAIVSNHHCCASFAALTQDSAHSGSCLKK